MGIKFNSQQGVVKVIRYKSNQKSENPFSGKFKRKGKISVENKNFLKSLGFKVLV